MSEKGSIIDGRRDRPPFECGGTGGKASRGADAETLLSLLSGGGRRIFRLSLAALWLLGAASAAAKTHPKAGTTSATFLKIGAGARAAAMGEAFGAQADDASALYWNPAGAVQLPTDEFTVMHDESFQDIRYEYAAYVHPFSNGRRAFGLSASGLFLQNDLERRSGLGESVPETPLTPAEGTFGGHDLSVGASYAWRAARSLAVGATLKGIQQSLAQYQGNGAAVDAGLLYAPPRWPVRIAAVVQNVGPKLKLGGTPYALPLNAKLGAAWAVSPKTDIALDLNQPVDNYLRVQMGAEYRPIAFCAVRAGYMLRTAGNDLGATSGLTLGTGFRFGAVWLDYALNPMGVLGDNHRISLSYRFGGKGASRERGAVAAPLEVSAEDAAVPFNLRLKPLRGKSVYRVVAEANASAELYRMTFDVEVSSIDGKGLGVLESGEEENDGMTYRVIALRHNFPAPLRNIGAAFRVEKLWLKRNKLGAADVSLVRMEGDTPVPQPVRVTGENDEYVSYRAQVDREGVLAIRARAESAK